MIPLSRNDIATLRGCTPATVSRAPLPFTKDKKKNVYDLTDPTVFAYVTEHHVKQRLAELRNLNPDDTEDLDLLKAERIRIINENGLKQGRKLDLQHDLAIRRLVDISLIDYYLGNIGAAIETNFLTIPNRAAKGNVKQIAVLEKLIKKAIEKTLKVAGDMLRKETERIINEGQED